jgi:hypothetical protein
MRSIEAAITELEEKLKALLPTEASLRRTDNEPAAEIVGHDLRKDRERLNNELEDAKRKQDRTDKQLRALEGSSAIENLNEPLIETYILLTFLAVVCGFTLVGLLFPLLAMAGLGQASGSIKRIRVQYLVSLLIAFGAAGAVYFGNGLLK